MKRAGPWFIAGTILLILSCCFSFAIPGGGINRSFNDDGGIWNAPGNDPGSGSWDWGGDSGSDSGSWDWGGNSGSDSGSWDWGGSSGSDSGSWDSGGGWDSGSWDSGGGWDSGSDSGSW